MKAILAGFLLLFIVGNAFSQNEKGRKKEFNLKKGIAIQGYDPVSYFSSHPVQGKEDINYTYEGVTYLFATAENRKKFKENPTKYEPQYGGWCAYAIGGSGDKVKIDPKTFKIVNGKVYLFYNFKGDNTLEYWNEKEKELKAKADKNWKVIVEQ